MSRNGSGTYTLPAGNPVVTGTTIASTWANTTLSDIASALTDSIAADGQTTMTGQLDLGNNKIINLANGTNSADAVTYSQMNTAISAAIATVTGKIVQIVSSQKTTTASTTSSSLVSASHSLSITPTSTSSKILLLQNATLAQTSDNTASANAQVTLFRDSTNLAGSGGIMGNQNIGYDGSIYGNTAMVYLDSPSSTSSITYSVYFASSASTTSLYNFGFGAQKANLIAVEIL
jgi:hypothetical protein